MNLWSISCNWSGKLAPAAGDDLIFPASILNASSNNFAAGTAFNSINISGGHVMSGAAIVLNSGITASNGVIQLASITLNLNNHVFNAPTPGVGGFISSPIDTNGKLLQMNGPGNWILTGVISGSGNLSKLNSGTVQLAGNNTYSGITEIFAGTLLVSGSQPSSSISVFGGTAVLGGTGTVGPVAVNGGGSTVAPGAAANGTGILQVNGSLTFERRSSKQKLAIDIKGTSAGSGYDRLAVANNGTVDVGTGNELEVTLGGGFVPALGDTFVIIDNAGSAPILGVLSATDAGSNTFQARPEGALLPIGPTTFQISYVGGDGNDLTLTAVSGAVAFTTSTFSINEGGGAASITLRRTGGGSTTAMAAVALEDLTTSAADYLSPAGKLDSTFNAAGNFNFLTEAAVQPDGKIIVVGSFSSSNPGAKTIARFNPDGSLDPSFDPGTGANGFIAAVAVQANGKILIGGGFSSYAGTPRVRIARLNENGSVDPTFDPGSGPSSDVLSIAMQSDGKIIIGGRFSSYGGASRPIVARLSPSGSLDSSFVPDVVFTPFGNLGPVVNSVAIDDSDRILIGGLFVTSGSAPSRQNVARLNANGSLDTSFDPGTGTTGARNGSVITILAERDGKIVISGRFDTYNGIHREGVARLENNGAVDPSFDPHGGVNAEVSCMAVQPDGKIVLGGGFSSYDGVARSGIVRIRSDGSLDRTFDPGRGAISASVSALVLQSDGKLVIAGGFNSYDGSPTNVAARVQGDLIATWGPNDFTDKTVLLPIVDDNLFEGDEKLTLRIVPLTAGQGTPSSAELTIVDNDPPPSQPAKAINISTRLRVETGDNVMIAGFIITGNSSRNVVLRGMGPFLGALGVSDFLADPVLDLRGPGGTILKNNDWKDTQRAQIEGTFLQPGDDRESVIVATLPPGPYTAILTGNNDTTGVGLVEVYDVSPASDSELANISTRGLVQGADSVMIGGFVLGGDNGGSRIVLRGIGPSLAQLGLSNVLANPNLELRSGDGTLLISNEDWQDDPVSAGQLSANGLGLNDPKEAGVFTSLPPGPYTAILSGKDGGTGIGLIEIYNLK